MPIVIKNKGKNPIDCFIDLFSEKADSREALKISKKGYFPVSIYFIQKDSIREKFIFKFLEFGIIQNNSGEINFRHYSLTDFREALEGFPYKDSSLGMLFYKKKIFRYIRFLDMVDFFTVYNQGKTFRMRDFINRNRMFLEFEITDKYSLVISEFITKYDDITNNRDELIYYLDPKSKPKKKKKVKRIPRGAAIAVESYSEKDANEKFELKHVIDEDDGDLCPLCDKISILCICSRPKSEKSTVMDKQSALELNKVKEADDNETEEDVDNNETEEDVDDNETEEDVSIESKEEKKREYKKYKVVLDSGYIKIPEEVTQYDENTIKNMRQHFKASSKDKEIIGDLGEKYIFNLLKEKYKKDDFVKILWMKQMGHPHEHYDIKLIIENSEYFIEVKSTINNEKLFTISEPELNLAKNKGEMYILYHVNNVGAKNTGYKKFKNFYHKFEKSKFQIKSRKLKF